MGDNHQEGSRNKVARPERIPVWGGLPDAAGRPFRGRVGANLYGGGSRVLQAANAFPTARKQAHGGGDQLPKVNSKNDNGGVFHLHG